MVGRKGCGVKFDIQIYARNGRRPALEVIADALECPIGEAEAVLSALVDAGYGIAPRVPTNGMIAAYIATTNPPRNYESVITAIGKARARWEAMLCQGTRMAFSRKGVAQGIEAGTDETRSGSAEGESPSRSVRPKHGDGQ